MDNGFYKEMTNTIPEFARREYTAWNSQGCTIMAEDCPDRHSLGGLVGPVFSPSTKGTDGKNYLKEFCHGNRENIDVQFANSYRSV